MIEAHSALQEQAAKILDGDTRRSFRRPVTFLAQIVEEHAALVEHLEDRITPAPDGGDE